MVHDNDHRVKGHLPYALRSANHRLDSRHRRLRVGSSFPDSSEPTFSKLDQALVRDGFIPAVVETRDAYAHSAPNVGGVEGEAALQVAAKAPKAAQPGPSHDLRRICRRR